MIALSEGPRRTRRIVRLSAGATWLSVATAAIGCTTRDSTAGAMPGGDVVLNLVADGNVTSAAELYRVGSSDNTSFARVGGLAAMAGDRVVVLDAGARAVHVVDRSGRQSSYSERAGGGPGEFLNEFTIVGPAAVSDSVYAVYDFAARRITGFALTGAVAWERTAVAWRQPGGPVPLTLAVGGDAWVLEIYKGFSIPADTVWDNRGVLVKRSLTEAVAPDTLTTWTRSDLLAGVSRNMVAPLVVPDPFGARTLWALSREGVLAIVSAGDSVITLTELDTGASRRVVITGVDRVIRVADRAAARARFPWGAGLSDVPAEQRDLARHLLALAPRHAWMPWFDEAVFDRAGRLWLRLWAIRGSATARWYRVDAARFAVDTYEIPSRGRFTAIGDTTMFTVVRTSLGVEELVAYDID